MFQIMNFADSLKIATRTPAKLTNRCVVCYSIVIHSDFAFALVFGKRERIIRLP